MKAAANHHELTYNKVLVLINRSPHVLRQNSTVLYRNLLGDDGREITCFTHSDFSTKQLYESIHSQERISVSDHLTMNLYTSEGSE